MRDEQRPSGAKYDLPMTALSPTNEYKNVFHSLTTQQERSREPRGRSLKKERSRSRSKSAQKSDRRRSRSNSKSKLKRPKSGLRKAEKKDPSDKAEALYEQIMAGLM